MSFESQVNAVVNDTLIDANPHWVCGTLFVDCEDAGALILKTRLEQEVVSPDVKIDINCLKATATEPWDQFAFDFVL